VRADPAASAFLLLEVTRSDQTAADVTREHIDALLTELDKQPISRRTVNKHRALLHAIFNFSRFPDQRARWGVEQNPVTDTDARTPAS